MTDLEPPAQRCLERTRSAVLNVLMVIAAGIALSGFLLRQRDQNAVKRGPAELGQALLGALFVVVVASYATRRFGASRARLHAPETRADRFYRAHLGSAILGGLATGLGLCYGWWIRPWLDAVSPFWVASLALGFLALPRAELLRGFELPLPENE